MHEFLESLSDYLTDPSQAVTLILQIFPSALSIAAYIFQGLYLTALCRASGRGAVWMAWVPFANLYLLGLMADIYTDTYFPTGILREPEDAFPSTLRRRMLGFSIVSNISGTVAGMAFFVSIATGFVGFLMILFSFGETANDPDTERLLQVFEVSFPIFLAAAAIWVVFEILYLVAFSKSHYRVCMLVGVSMPVLWTFLGIVFPLVPAILLFVRTRNSATLAKRFSPYREDAAPDGDRDAPPPAKPPIPELYQL